MYCTNCGKEIDEEYNYCKYCEQEITPRKGIVSISGLLCVIAIIWTIFWAVGENIKAGNFFGF